MNPELLSAKSLARWLGVSTRTVQRWRDQDSFIEPVNGYWSRTSVTLWFAEVHAAITTSAHGGESSSALHMRSAVRRALRQDSTSRGQSPARSRPT